MEERRAIARLKQGDIAGLEVLVRIHQTRALRAADLILRDRALAEDVVQAAFLRAYERIDQFDETRPFGPWFLRSVVNDALQAIRRRQPVPLEPEDASVPGSSALHVADPSPAPLEAVMAGETRAEVWQALGRLAPEQRAAVICRYYLDMSEAEIAEALACPNGTVKWRLHAARRRLRHLLRSLAPAASGPARQEVEP